MSNVDVAVPIEVWVGSGLVAVGAGIIFKIAVVLPAAIGPGREYHNRRSVPPASRTPMIRLQKRIQGFNKRRITVFCKSFVGLMGRWAANRMPVPGSDILPAVWCPPAIRSYKQYPLQKDPEQSKWFGLTTHLPDSFGYTSLYTWELLLRDSKLNQWPIFSLEAKYYSQSIEHAL